MFHGLIGCSTKLTRCCCFYTCPARLVYKYDLKYESSRIERKGSEGGGGREGGDWLFEL